MNNFGIKLLKQHKINNRGIIHMVVDMNYWTKVLRKLFVLILMVARCILRF